MMQTDPDAPRANFADEATPLALAMVLLPTERGASADAMKAALERLFPEVAAERVDEEKDGTFALLSADGAGWIVSHVPGPVPKSDLDHALALSPSIEEDAPVLAHRTHLIVVSQGGALSPAERRSHLSVGVAAAARASEAVGVYWGEGSVVHEVTSFVEEVAAEPVPVSLWFGVSVARPSEHEIEFLSVGLRYLAHPDLLVAARLEDADAAFGFLYDCASYAVESGKTLQAGETIGLSADYALAIEAIDSPVEPGALVLKIRYVPPG